MIIPLIITIIIGFFLFIFDKHARRYEHLHTYIVSFSSGMFVTYIFLSMFPELVEGVGILGNSILFIMFWGFVLFHIAEKYVFQHKGSARTRQAKMVKLRTTAFFVNHIVLGIAVVFFFQTGQTTLGYVSFIPILFHLISSSLIVEHLHHIVKATNLSHLLSSMSLFLGSLVAFIITIPLHIYYGIFAFLVGILLYIIVRDTIPPYREGNSTFFLFGIIFYLAILLVETMA